MKCMDKHEFEQQNVFGTGAATTGTSTTRPRAAASCWFAPQAKAGTRKRANLPSA